MTVMEQTALQQHAADSATGAKNMTEDCKICRNVNN